ncbi:MAG: hypothetical protein P1P82_07705 [Bacteroidales bacterium]|nr:hypothetical protein [Bacteroidales bacterium]MDT8430403.1 hypothetical protein [Bacteroidales bacterium]
MKKTSLKWCILAALVVLPGCQKLFNKPDDVAKIDITDARYLGVDASANFQEGATNSLVKIKKGDALDNWQTVDFLDSEENFLGEDFIYADAWSIHPASEDFSIIAGEFRFNVKGEEQRHFGLVVNNHTGEIFGLGDRYWPEPPYGLQGAYYYQTDGEGNIYYVKSDLYRILVNDGEQLQLEIYMDGAAGIFDQRYLVDQQGNVYFQQGGRVKMHSGGIAETNMHFIAVNGADGKCYGFRQDWEDMEIPENVYVMQLEVKDGEFVATKITDDGFYFEGGTHQAYQYMDTDKQWNVIIANGYLVPDRNFGTEWCMGVIVDEASHALIPILTDASVYLQPMGIEGAYLWVERSADQYAALNLSSLEVDTTRNVAHITESIVFDLPAEFDSGGATFHYGGAGLNISGFNLATETKYKGKITIENGVEFYETDSVPYLETLTRIQ